MKKITTYLAVFLVAVSCSKKTDTTTTSDISEPGQQVADVSSSVDESGGGTSAISSVDQRSLSNNLLANDVQTYEKTFARYNQELGTENLNILSEINTKAECGASTFGSCSSQTITRTFGGCTMGAATFNGTVNLVWGGGASTCALSATSQHITRSLTGSGITITGRRGATLTTTNTGSVGQRLTWTSGSGTSRVFSFTNDGVKRVFTTSGGSTLFDFTTTTGSAITVTGTTRGNRTMSGGSLVVVNNLNSNSCTFVPSSVSWGSSSCNCPTSGSWSATCTNGDSYTLTINSCTTGTFTSGSTSESVTFDRCTGT